MYRILLIAVFLVSSLASVSAGTGPLTIIEQDWAAAQAAAKKENKLILIDFYATWCGPCKHFMRTLKEDEAFAAGIAEQYVMLKYNAETDNELLTQKHHIRAFPTFIVVTPEGQRVAKRLGGLYTDDPTGHFLNFLKEAALTAEEGRYVKGVSTQIDLGYPEFYTKFVNRESREYKDKLAAYWAEAGDLKSELNFIMLSYFSGDDRVNNYFLNNYNEYVDWYGEEDCVDVKHGIARTKLSQAASGQDEIEWKRAVAYARELMGEESHDAIVSYQQKYYIQSEQWSALTDWTASRILDGAMSDNQINSISWTLYEDCDDQPTLKMAAAWMEPVIERSPEYAYLDTYAWLLYKIGDKEKAVKYIKQAIEAGQAEGMNTRSSEAMLDME